MVRVNNELSEQYQITAKPDFLPLHDIYRDMAKPCVEPEHERGGNYNIGQLGFPDLNIYQSPEYQVGKGDTLWGISKEFLSLKLGHTPSNNEIANGVNDIARENHLKNPDKLAIGQHLSLPESMLPVDEKLAQQEQAGPPKPAPEAPTLVVPGLGINGDKDLHDSEISKVGMNNGMQHVETQGSLNDGYIFNTSFKSQSDTDLSGRMRSSEVEYSNTWSNPTISIPDGHGGMQEVTAQSAKTTWNSRTHHYDTVITDTSDKSYAVETDDKGHVIQK